MITKELFIKYINNWIKFEEGIDRIDHAISGDSKYSIGLFESDWYDAVGIMLDTFLSTHFSDEGCDLINSYLFDFINKHEITIYEELTLFNKHDVIVIDNLDKLWNFLNSDKKLYFKHDV